MTSRSAEDSTTGWPFAQLTPQPRRSKRIVFREPNLDNVEDVYMYGPDGFHPLNLGDVIQHRYKIIHKLGNGGFALVWLARDLDEGRYVALKIMKANAPDREIRILEHLNKVAGNLRITKLHESFMIHGPNGIHQCLVLQLGGPTLKHISLYHESSELPFRTVAARKLVEGLATLHAAGVCHGDLTHSNVVFEINGIQNWTEDELYRYLGRPKTALLLLMDGKPAPAYAPAHIVEGLDYSTLQEQHLSNNILITDFGEAFFIDNVPKGLGTPASFYAPELLFGYQPSCAVDLWALACLIFELYTSHVLLPAVFGSDEEALAYATATIGVLPEAWQDRFHNKDRPLKAKNPDEKHPFFDSQIQRGRTLNSQLLKILPEMPQHERATLVQLISSILIFEPSHRLPAAKVAKHVWFERKS